MAHALRITALTLGAVILVGCSSEPQQLEDVAVSIDEPTAAVVSAAPEQTGDAVETPVPAQSMPEEASEPPTDWELGIPADVPAGVVRLPAAGGVRFIMENPRTIFQHDTFFALPDPDLPPGQGGMIGIEIHQTMNPTEAIESKEQVLALIENHVTPVPLDDDITISGKVFEGYRMQWTPPSTFLTTPNQLFTAGELGAPGVLWWFPLAEAVIYIADSDNGGVLVFGYESGSPEGFQVAKSYFDEVMPTMELIPEEFE